MLPVFSYFTELIKKRLEKDRDFNDSEDSIRYTFFYALTKKEKYKPENIILEHPFKNKLFKKDKLDFYACSNDKNNNVAIEFKYHRGGDSGYTEGAGQIFWDISKLLNFTAENKFLIYLTDAYMRNYFNNPKNRHDLFRLKVGGRGLRITKKYLSKYPKTFKIWTEGDGYFDKCNIGLSYESELPRSHFLKIFRVE